MKIGQPASSHACSAILALLLAAGAAHAQQEATASEESAISEVNEFGPPQQLPGHEEGPRERPTEEQAPPPPPPAPEARDWFGAKPWWEWQTATGDWAGARTTLEEHGLTISASYVLDWSSVWSGGLANRASTRSLFDVNATFDLDKAFEWHGATFYVDFYSTDMRGGTRDVGDYQGIDNIETGRNLDQLAEVWFQQTFFDDLIRLKLGKIDANSEFAFLDSASGLISSTSSMSPTMIGLPTYPDPATGVVLFAYPTENWYVGGGFFDGATSDGISTGPRGPETFFSDDESDSWFWIFETGLTWKELASLGKGRISAGFTHHTATFETFSGDLDDATTTFYAMAEQQLVRRGEAEELAEKGLFVFARYGWADEDVSDATNHFAAGVSLFGTFDGCDDDEAGAYYSFVDLSDADGAGYDEDEHLIEFYYKIQVTPWFSVRPDLQFVINPGGDPTIDDAVVGMLRFEATF